MGEVEDCSQPVFSKPPENVSWASRCFGSSSSSVDRVLEYVAPSSTDVFAVASCRRSEVELSAQKWVGSVFGFLLGKKPHLPSLRKYLLAKWNLSGSLDLSFQTDGAFILRFGSVDEKIKVLESGPWFVGGRLLVLKPWRKRLRRSEFNLSSVPLWIWLPNLPLEFWSKDSLSRIGSLVGILLFCDEFKLSQNRTSFARICVEVDATTEIPNKVLVDVEGSERFEQEFIVEWRPPSCTVCKCFSHSEKTCKKKLSPQVQVCSRSQWSGEVPKLVMIDQSKSQVQNKIDVVVAENNSGWVEVIRKKNFEMQNGLEPLELDREELEKIGFGSKSSVTAGEEDGNNGNFAEVEIPLVVSNSAGKQPVQVLLNSNLDGLVLEKSTKADVIGLEIGTVGDDLVADLNKDRRFGGETLSGRAGKAGNFKRSNKALGGLKIGVENQECRLVNSVGKRVLEDWNIEEGGRLDKVIFKSNIDGQDVIREVEDDSSVESMPPGFCGGRKKFRKEKSTETAIHPTEECSDSEEENNCFSSRRARMIREKLGISNREC